MATVDRPTTAAALLAGWEPWYFVPRSQVWEGSRGAAAGNVHLIRWRGTPRGHGQFPAFALYPTSGPGRALLRANGDALCGRKGGWYERPAHRYENDEERCPRCAATADRYGITWPDVMPEELARRF